MIPRPHAETARLTLAERKRLLVRDELGAAALQLIARQGFEETTVDQIVAAAGVSRRTFFRYFESKEDVIIDSISDIGESIRVELAARPRDEPPVRSLREALSVAENTFAEDPEKSVALIRIILRNPALRARFLAHQDALKSELAAVLAPRTGDDTGGLRAQLAAGIALLAFASALATWAESGGARVFGEVLDEAFAHAAAALS